MAQSGLGRAPNGAIIADEDWWKTHTEVLSSTINYFVILEMFHGVIVDGTTSTILGGVNIDEGGAEYEDDLEDGIDNSPLSNNSRKRGSSTTDTATSPPKKSKNSFFKMFKGFIDTMQAGSSQDTNTIRVKEEIKMELRMKQKEIEIEFRRKQKEIEMEERRKTQEKEDQEIELCITLAQECGATDETEEFYMATKLFEKSIIESFFEP
ncbi:hypothetical protein GUJ93_ZPchr0004g38762 [Zizania palustris]|uniref:No apical meristem-associated C-terminal domain-containing protein n=1 Tax=Zizania palustris TaxID=103762 RepID=A0A8J5S0K6_ZIZPA|nr:hypothetical protein GUJ93_ZPchr0004g38762 [Zizania palustris]